MKRWRHIISVSEPDSGWPLARAIVKCKDIHLKPTALFQQAQSGPSHSETFCSSACLRFQSTVQYYL